MRTNNTQLISSISQLQQTESGQMTSQCLDQEHHNNSKLIIIFNYLTSDNTFTSNNS